MDKIEFYKQLIGRYRDGSASDEEVEVFFHLMETGKMDPVFAELLDAELGIGEGDRAELRSDGPHRRLGSWIGRAAAVLLVLSLAGGGYILFSRKQAEPVSTAAVAGAERHDLPPGSNRAVLTLANGEKIVLDGAANGSLAQQGNVEVVKKADGEIEYDGKGRAGGENMMNVVVTPRGGQFMIGLPDGTKVWLNAASSIQYPVAFSGSDRTVTLTGEAYFEVAPDKTKPFHVKAAGTNVDVLGTHFNVNAYEDDRVISTTLLEGAVRVSKGNGSAVLQPGEQARFAGDEPMRLMKVDGDEVIAWKNGVFLFNNSSIESIMRQVARWYDVDVVYEGKVPSDKFKGEVPRSVNISSVLRVLEVSGTHFRIEGKKIVVLP